MNQNPNQNPSFEKAFSRLEEILEKMSSGAVPLEDSLSLYEEANQLIQSCSQTLQEAEKKIELLVKSSDGEIATDEKGEPLTQDFTSNKKQLLEEEH